VVAVVTSSAAVDPAQRLAELQRSIETARHDVDALAAEISQTAQRLNELKHAGPELERVVHEQASHLQESVQATLSVLQADVATLHNNLQATAELVQSEMDELHSLCQQVVEAFSHLEASVGALTEAMQSDQHILTSRATASAQNVTTLVQTLAARLHGDSVKTVQELSQTADTVQQAVTHSYSALEHTLQGAIQQDLAHSGQLANQRLQALAQQFAQQLREHGQTLATKIQENWQHFQDEQQQRVQHVTDGIHQLQQGIEHVVSQVRDLGSSTTKTVDTLIDGVDAVNVGFKVTIGTLENIESVLKEIHL
jgi:chromosome segregation ATPase